MKTLLLLFCLALGLLELPAQTVKIDSLKRVIETTKVDTMKAECYYKLANLYVKAGNYDQAERACVEAERLSRRIRFLPGVAWSAFFLGRAYQESGRPQEAIAVFHRAAPLLGQIKEYNVKQMCYGNIANCFNDLGISDSSIFYSRKSYEYFMANRDYANAAISLISLGTLLIEAGRHPEALKRYQEALRILPAQDQSGSETVSKAKAYIMANLSTLYSNMNEHETSAKYRQEAIEVLETCRCEHRLLASLLGNSFGELKTGGNLQYVKRLRRAFSIADSLQLPVEYVVSAARLAEYAMLRKDIDSALHFLQRAEAVVQYIAEIEARAHLNQTWAKYYIATGNPRKAREHAENALAASRKLNIATAVSACLLTLINVDSALGDYRSAFQRLKAFHQIRDSLRSSEKSREVGRLEARYEAEKERKVLEARQEVERTQNQWALGSASGGLLLLAAIAFTLFRGRRKEKKANEALRSLNEEIQQQKAEIEAINAELHATLDEVNQQKTQIEDSIRYASRIQLAILPSQGQLRESLPSHFIHYQPRDIVSGDFYWVTKQGGKTFFAAVDCTGHGVPGAFMSVLGSNLLHQIVDENQITEPDVILAELDRRISATLRQQFGGASKDGMDVALVVLHEADANGSRTVEFAGAGRPLWHFHGGEITEYKSARYACGGSQHEAKQYPATRIEARAGDRFYLFSDGSTDQFGGPQGRKLGSGQLRAFLLETASLPVDKQGEAFAAFFNDWIGARKQLDDVLVAGVAV